MRGEQPPAEPYHPAVARRAARQAAREAEPATADNQTAGRQTAGRQATDGQAGQPQSDPGAGPREATPT
jgi:hypothetical protein